MSEQLSLTISRDEALVLFEMLARFAETSHFGLQHNAEFIALSRICRQLDQSLTEPFLPTYIELLQQARTNVAAGYEGLAPGVIQSEE